MNAPGKTTRKPNLGTKRTIIIALIVFVSASLVGFKSYREIQSEFNQTVSLLSDIKIGESNLTIRHDSRCIGRFNINYNEGKDLGTISIDAQVFLLIDGKELFIPITGRFSLNALLQVGGSFFEVKLGEGSIFLGTKGVQTIEFQVSVHNNGIAKSFTLPLQGPIVLKQNADEKFSLVMPGSDHLKRLIGQSHSLPTLGSSITLDAVNNCGGKFDSLDISPLMHALGSLQVAIPVLGQGK